MITTDWDGAFRMLWNRAADSRGLRGFADELPTVDGGLARWPRTLEADVLEIATVVDVVLHVTPRGPGWYGVNERWQRCKRDLADVAVGDRSREYRHNRMFWSTLASIAAYLSTAEVPVPEDMWGALLNELTVRDAPQLATPGASAGELQLTALTYDELWRAQRDQLAQLRGADTARILHDFYGDPVPFPRTTSADVIQLAAYWNDALSEVSRRRREGNYGPDDADGFGLDGEERRWRATMIDVGIYAEGDLSDIYALNDEFWQATCSLAATLAELDEDPPPFELRSDISPRAAMPRRNATYPAGGIFQAMWSKQHRDFVAARGFDPSKLLAVPSGEASQIPRTTNADMRALASYWGAPWRKLLASFGDAPPAPVAAFSNRWKPLAQDLERKIEGLDQDVYPYNDTFWIFSHELARMLDEYKQVPARFDVPLQVDRPAPVQVERSPSDRFAEIVSSVAHAVGDVADRAAREVTSGIGKQIAIGGGVVLGSVLLWHLLRPRAPEAV